MKLLVSLVCALIVLPLILLLSLMSAVWQEGHAGLASLEALRYISFRSAAPSAPFALDASLKTSWPRPWATDLSLQAPQGLPGLEEGKALWRSGKAALREMRLRHDFDKVFNGSPKPDEVEILESDFWDNRHLMIFYEYRYEITLSVPRDSRFRTEYLETLKRDLELSRVDGPARCETWRSSDGSAWLILDLEGDTVCLGDSRL